MKSHLNVLEKLKKQGFRLTKVRRAVLKLLHDSKTPLSVPDIITRLKRRDLPVNKTTIYRELGFLLTQKVVREIDLLEGKKRYEVLGEGGHHHHIVCLKCKTIRCIDMHRDLDSLEKQILSSHKFKVLSHTLEFFGLCARCV